MVVEISLRAELWSLMDCSVDGSAQEAAEDGEPYEPWHRIREAGWSQVPWVGAERAWPPMQQVITIGLTEEQWKLVLSSVEFWDEVGREMGDEPDELWQEAVAVIVRSLDR